MKEVKVYCCGKTLTADLLLEHMTSELVNGLFGLLVSIMLLQWWWSLLQGKIKEAVSRDQLRPLRNSMSGACMMGVSLTEMLSTFIVTGQVGRLLDNAYTALILLLPHFSGNFITVSFRFPKATLWRRWEYVWSTGHRIRKWSNVEWKSRKSDNKWWL